jgi:glycyl-tRNA synthetase beta subunit
MNLKEKTKQELEQRIEKLENIIASEGVGSDYLEKAERIQRDLNLALLLGTSAAVLGISAWAIYKMNDE